jgi:hypothetical protein
LILFAVFLIVRRREGAARRLFVGVAGFAGMVLETQLLLYYQVRRGILYQDLGILLMSFMAGLALGAVLIDRRERVLPRPVRAPAAAQILLIAAFALLSGFLAWLFSSDLDSGLTSTSLLLGISGILVAGVFANAGAGHGGDARLVIGPLYSADLIGGCAGSLAASLVLVPALGLTATSLLLIPMLALSAVLVKRS